MGSSFCFTQQKKRLLAETKSPFNFILKAMQCMSDINNKKLGLKNVQVSNVTRYH